MTDLSVGATSQRCWQRRPPLRLPPSPPTVPGDDLSGGAPGRRERPSSLHQTDPRPVTAGGSSTLILTGTSVAGYADLSSPLDETRVFDSWRVFGVSMSASASATGAVTAL